MVTGNYFQVIGAPSEIGRTLLADDDRKDSTPVVMLGHNFWRRHFPPDASVLGSKILVDGQSFTIVGVTPQGFGGVSFENFPEIWLPITYGIQIDPLLRSQIPQNHKSFVPFAVIGRLNPNIAMPQAQAQMNILAERNGAGKPDAHEGPDWKRPWPVLVPVTDAARQQQRAILVPSAGDCRAGAFDRVCRCRRAYAWPGPKLARKKLLYALPLEGRERGSSCCIWLRRC